VVLLDRWSAYSRTAGILACDRGRRQRRPASSSPAGRCRRIGWRPAVSDGSIADLSLELLKPPGARCVLRSLRGSSAQADQTALNIPCVGWGRRAASAEARASSEIEHIVTTADRIVQHLVAEGVADPATEEALRYRRALLERFGNLEDRPLSTGTVGALCSRIKGVVMAVRRVPGAALANATTREVIRTPPATEQRIRRLPGDWEPWLTFPENQARAAPRAGSRVAHSTAAAHLTPTRPGRL